MGVLVVTTKLFKSACVQNVSYSTQIQKQEF